jgi:hypothetical protein
MLSKHSLDECRSRDFGAGGLAINLFQYFRR